MIQFSSDKVCSFNNILKSSQYNNKLLITKFRILGIRTFHPQHTFPSFPNTDTD